MADAGLQTVCDSEDEDTVLPSEGAQLTVGDMAPLFAWAKVYAGKLIGAESEHHGSQRDYCLQNIGKLLQFNIEHHENFAGSGSSGIALHMAHKAFCWAWLAAESQTRSALD